MKRILPVAAVVMLAFAAGPAGAATITVDFSPLGTTSVDITARFNPTGLTLDGVNFIYETFVDTTTCGADPTAPGCLDFASVDENGVLGIGTGVLSLGFSVPVSELSLDFFNFVAPTPPDWGLRADFGNGDSEQFGTQFGTLNHVGTTPFTSVDLFFSLEAAGFTVGNVSYVPAEITPEPVPEPGTLILLGLGMLGVARRVRKNR